jgi:hypothetical protein
MTRKHSQNTALAQPNVARKSARAKEAAVVNLEKQYKDFCQLRQQVQIEESQQRVLSGAPKALPDALH